MAHKEQRRFCKMVKELYPLHFKRVNVIDVGSQDINGNNRYLFSRSKYIGVDVCAGKNVDVIGAAHEVLPKIEAGLRNVFRQVNKDADTLKVIQTVISTEALEHDKHFEKTLKAMYDVLMPGGLLLITAGGDGREEHGTSEKHPECSPGTLDYYKNVSNEMFLAVLPPYLFKDYFIRQFDKTNDFQFFGIKAILD